MLTYILVLAVGIFMGCMITKILIKPKNAGTLLLYKGENDEFMSLYLELDDVPEKLYKCKQVTFNVKPTRG